MKSTRILFIFLILQVTAVFIIGFTHQKPTINDSIEYEYAASNMLNFNILYSGNMSDQLDFRLYTKRTLGYPIFMLFQHQNTVIVNFIQSLIVLLNFLLGISLIKIFTNKRRVFMLFSIGYTLHLSLLIHSQFILSDLLFTSIITLIAQVFYSKTDSPKNKIWIISILWTAAVVVKPVLLPSVFLAPLLIVWLLVRTKKWRLSLMLPLLIITIASAINYQNIKKAEYSSISTINLAQYNAKLTIAKKYGYDSAQSFVSSDALRIPRTIHDYAAYKTNARNLGTQAILDNLFSYLQVHTLGTIKMILDPGRFELYTFFNEPTNSTSLTEMIFSREWTKLVSKMKENILLFILFLVLLLISVLKVIGAAISLKEWKKHLFLISITLYFLILTGPVGAARFFLPASIIYLVMAALGWDNILNFFQKRSKR
ncbi:MAG: hypothetical protein COA58_07640 [Bacteroidetes bacterium]|nr:MAG: hypothetical protein COA58_07640 [Bacteroidota bacterium]